MVVENRAIIIARDLIKGFEGLRLEPYYCSAGFKTIGYGHVIRKNEEIASYITKEQAGALLDEDIKTAARALNLYCRVVLNYNQQAALISFIFNLGAGMFQSSTLRQKLNRGEYILAANELPKWVYAGGVKLSGLVRRRAAERNLFLQDMELAGAKLRRKRTKALPPTLTLYGKLKDKIARRINIH